MVTGSPSGPGRDVQGASFDVVLRVADGVTSFVERPLRKLSGSARLNPLPHAGTISVFLLGVVVLTGLYITLFFSFGYAASYDSVASMEEHAIQRIVRAMHRYSSAALVLTTLVHAWRIFTAKRFTSRNRRWRWSTGAAALGLVWLAGVSGYLLVWDRRAAAISEATAQLLGGFGPTRGFVVRNLLGLSPTSGSGFLLFLWFVHLGLTAVIGWFMYRHVRRSRQPWFPPVHWMAIMGGSLFVVSVLFPLGMLGPARPDQLVANMPLDPFVLFLLPPLLSSARWLAVVAMLAVAVFAISIPWFLRRLDQPPIVIDDEACTGCEICVQDCPYEALEMGRSSVTDRQVAVVDESRCVSCGICVGSCAFDAIELPGWASTAHDVSGRDVKVVCSRHEQTFPEATTANEALVWVSCAGMFAPNAIRGYTERGATSVELIGCAPSDCRYGIGNQLAEERLSGERAPHPPRRFANDVSHSWVGVGDVARRLTSTDGEFEAPPDRSRLTAPALVVLVSVLAIVAATRAPFRTDTEVAALRVVVDHVAGAEVLELAEPIPGIETVELAVDGEPRELRDIAASGSHSLGFTDWSISPGLHQIDIALLAADGGRTSLFADEVVFDARERLVLTAFDVPPDPSSEDGRRVFESRAAGCAVCHSVEHGRAGVGPSLYGVADRGGSLVAGLTVEQYLRQSILLPDQYIVDGWPSGQMLPIYRERLTDHELEALLAYLATLSEQVG